VIEVRPGFETDEDCMPMRRVLFVEDDEALRITQTLYLRKEGFEVVAVPDRVCARRELGEQLFDVVVTDLKLGKESGIDVLRDARELQPDAELLVITGYGSVDTAVAAMKEGAYDYLNKPIDPQRLVHVLNRALEHQGLQRQILHLKDQYAEKAGLNHIVAVSELMQQVLQTIRKVASSSATILIEGESGTGKELMARLIHQASGRTAGPFLGINCGAVPENLLESELFGHVRGSFTGAHKDQKGLFEAADRGTLFLDEIADLSPNFQVKLLRTLQEHKVRRVGDTRETRVDVRVIAATNQDLARLVREGRFRQDLFFRVKVIPVYLPPLRKRPEDILPLAERYLARLSKRMGRRSPLLSESAKRKLLGHEWPGNVRELENTLERALIFKKGDQISAADLALETCLPTQDDDSADSGSWEISLEELEKRHILRVLAHCDENKVKAADVLGIGYNTLWRKLKRYGES